MKLNAKMIIAAVILVIVCASIMKSGAFSSPAPVYVTRLPMVSDMPDMSMISLPTTPMPAMLVPANEDNLSWSYSDVTAEPQQLPDLMVTRIPEPAPTDLFTQGF